MDLESLLCGSFLIAKDRAEIRSKFDITRFVLKMNHCLPHSLFPRFQLRYYLSLQSISVYLSAMFSCIFVPLSLSSVPIFPNKTLFSLPKWIEKEILLRKPPFVVTACALVLRNGQEQKRRTN